MGFEVLHVEDPIECVESIKREYRIRKTGSSYKIGFFVEYEGYMYSSYIAGLIANPT